MFTNIAKVVVGVSLVMWGTSIMVGGAISVVRSVTP